MWTYTKTILETCQYFQSVVLRGNPGHPAEKGQRLEEVIREPKVDEHRPKGPQKELVA